MCAWHRVLRPRALSGPQCTGYKASAMGVIGRLGVLDSVLAEVIKIIGQVIVLFFNMFYNVKCDFLMMR